MFFKQREETMTIKEFMNRGKEKEILHECKLVAYEKANPAGWAMGLSTLPLIFTPLTSAQTASADALHSVPVAGIPEMYDKMVTAFDPLIVLVQSLAYPIATVVVLGRAIMVMIGMKEKGYSLMMSAGLGYVLVNMTPMILNILVDAMRAV